MILKKNAHYWAADYSNTLKAHTIRSASHLLIDAGTSPIDRQLILAAYTGPSPALIDHFVSGFHTSHAAWPNDSDRLELLVNHFSPDLHAS
jgi:hypothetical protein